jgi:hypothetical protein
MSALNRTLAWAALGLSLSFTACGLSMRPVKFEANRADWKALEGEWRGEYWMSRYDRHGLITFRLMATPEAASGDVLMISDRFGWPYQQYPYDPAVRAAADDRTHLLTIKFVRAEDGDITGRMDAYWDPDRRCDAAASFRGSVDGDIIHGTVASICIGDIRGGISGRWKAERKPPMTAQ